MDNHLVTASIAFQTKEILVNNKLSNNKPGQYLDERPLSNGRYRKQAEACVQNLANNKSSIHPS